MRILSVGLFVIELHVVIWTKEHLSKGFTQHLLVNMLATGFSVVYLIHLHNDMLLTHRNNISYSSRK